MFVTLVVKLPDIAREVIQIFFDRIDNPGQVRAQIINSLERHFAFGVVCQGKPTDLKRSRLPAIYLQNELAYTKSAIRANKWLDNSWLHGSVLPYPLQDDDGDLASDLRLMVGEEGHLRRDLRPEAAVFLTLGDDGPRLKRLVC